MRTITTVCWESVGKKSVVRCRISLTSDNFFLFSTSCSTKRLNHTDQATLTLSVLWTAVNSGVCEQYVGYPSPLSEDKDRSLLCFISSSELVWKHKSSADTQQKSEIGSLTVIFVSRSGLSIAKRSRTLQLNPSEEKRVALSTHWVRLS